MTSSRSLGLERGRACVAYAAILLAERGEQGMSAKELEALVLTQCGGTPTSNKVLLIRARERGLIFGKPGTEPEHAQYTRYFDTQAHCEAFPVLPRRTRQEIAEALRELREQRRAEKIAAGIAEPKQERIVKAAAPKKSARGGLVGEPIITAATKVTIAPKLVDYRYHVDPSHRGAFSEEWQAKRGEAVVC
jgi:hypothetical protein